MARAITEEPRRPNLLMWVLIVGILITIGIYMATEIEDADCEFVGCNKPATVRMQSPVTSRVGFYCDEHSAIMHRLGWKVL